MGIVYFFGIYVVVVPPGIMTIFCSSSRPVFRQNVWPYPLLP